MVALREAEVSEIGEAPWCLEASELLERKHPREGKWLQCGSDWLRGDMEWQSLPVAWTRGIIMWWSIFYHYSCPLSFTRWSMRKEKSEEQSWQEIFFFVLILVGRRWPWN